MGNFMSRVMPLLRADTRSNAGCVGREDDGLGTHQTGRCAWNSTGIPSNVSST
jgi:hypothetical protein